MISVPLAGHVAEHRPARLVHERVDHLVGEAVRVGRHRLRGEDPHQLPVAGRRVLAARALDQPPGDRRRARLRRAAEQRLDVAEPERLERRQVEAADGAGEVAERVGALVAEVGGVGQLPGPDGVEDDHTGPRHRGYPNPVDTVLGLLAFCRLHRRGDLARGRHQLARRQADPEAAAPKPSGSTAPAPAERR